MTEKERTQLARQEARSIVARLKASNAEAARDGAPRVAATQYRGLEQELTRKLLRAS